MIFENHFVAFDFGNFKAIEASFGFAFPLEKPTQRLIHSHEVNRTYAPVEGDQSGHGLKALNRGRVKGHYSADVVKTKIVSDFIVVECLEVLLK